MIDGPILAIESSCDESAAAVVEGRVVRSSVVASQAHVHAPYGGVVPEVAARHHLGTINATIDAALQQASLDADALAAVAVTQRPGLIGALLVGMSTARGYAYARGLPMVMVDHLHGHIAAAWLDPVALDPPFVSLVASGGHTRLDLVEDLAHPRLLGQTIDDAAGEALDKGARMLGLPYPGGPQLEERARQGDPSAYRFPVALAGKDVRDFSFAGVKTALLYAVRDAGDAIDDARRADLAASYQQAVLSPLSARLIAAARAHRVPAVAIGGGVAANGVLRAMVQEAADAAGLRVAIPDRGLCTDNAAMIGAAAQWSPLIPWPQYLAMDAIPTTAPGGIAA